LRERDHEFDGLRGAVKAFKVFSELEDDSVIDANALEDSVSVKQAMVVYRNRGSRFRQPFPVNVNDRFLRTQALPRSG
jgi:hypothetical protein